ncbi:hypothetical protein BCR44DRAFT_45838, partial [Catenaria anguillulae PL171]
MARAKLHSPAKPSNVLDHALIVRFPGPKSFTGEDVVELHAHGGPAVVKSILSALGSLNGFRMADRGEFAHRAFLNGKLDLSEVEGLKDLVNAETEVQRQLAINQSSGALSSMYERWRTTIVSSMGHMEALIDFAEDEQFEDGVWDNTRNRITDLSASISTFLSDNRRGEILRQGIRTTLFGAPNAGKSSLLNHLAQRSVAIVSPIPGTTRDIVETTVDIAGYPVVVGDTAGIRPASDTQDAIELMGMHRARDRIENETDLRVCVMDLTRALEEQVPASAQAWITDQTLVVLNKADAVSLDVVEAVRSKVGKWTQHVAVVSLTSGQGVLELNQVLAQLLASVYGEAMDRTGAPVLTNARHRAHLEACQAALGRFLDNEHDVVLAAEELRLAATSIGRITGRVDTEAVLDVVFSDFCIGK